MRRLIGNHDLQVIALSSSNNVTFCTYKTTLSIELHNSAVKHIILMYSYEIDDTGIYTA